MIRRHVIVSGSVQGVGFRWSAREFARRLGVSGFARNRLDGTVEVEVEGEEEAVERMLAWLGSGPPGCQVDSVTVSDLVPRGDGAFRIHGTQ